MNPLEHLATVLTKLPGLGKKSAMRLALFLVKEEKGITQELGQALLRMKEKVRFCRLCQNLTEEEVCHLCRDDRRHRNQLCVVEGPSDLITVEKTGQYRGLYYLLHGTISPLDGVGPEELKLDRLVKRIREGKFSEVILATNPNVEGEATALYLKKLLTPLKVKMTRIASGVPIGGTLEYTDAQTMAQSLLTRREF
ncbi:MAG: recombination protein RecR [Deltaproteobacteria bacterium]|nr:recombination protein RecR [Deltaproteobacteria bacterium]MBI2501350.1 recombination protein RecR [Deltaproteobacteria bacterium]MBI4197388.1 recombination protein RecR [Deltaproteobacteria bacterium]